jgi:hypothetical protein
MIEPGDDRLWITAPEYQKECGTSLNFMPDELRGILEKNGVKNAIS